MSRSSMKQVARLASARGAAPLIVASRSARGTLPLAEREATFTPDLSPWGRVKSHYRAGAGSRRGVILLIVLGVLVIFSLAVLMFVISARQHKTSSQSQHKVERYDANHGSLLEQGLGQLLSGSPIPSSALKEHSLLEDIYGHESLPATPSDPSLVLAPLPANPAPTYPRIMASGSGTDSGMLLLRVQDLRIDSNPQFQQAGYFNGRVLTVLDGPARMQSTRIVGYKYDLASTTAFFQVLAFPNGAVPRPNPAEPNTRDALLVNGREFSGVGYGFDPNPGPSYGNTTLPDPDFPLPAALLLNTVTDKVPRTVDLAAAARTSPGMRPITTILSSLAGIGFRQRTSRGDPTDSGAPIAMGIPIGFLARCAGGGWSCSRPSTGRTWSITWPTTPANRSDPGYGGSTRSGRSMVWRRKHRRCTPASITIRRAMVQDRPPAEPDRTSIKRQPCRQRHPRPAGSRRRRQRDARRPGRGGLLWTSITTATDWSIASGSTWACRPRRRRRADVQAALCVPRPGHGQPAEASTSSAAPHHATRESEGQPPWVC